MFSKMRNAIIAGIGVISMAVTAVIITGAPAAHAAEASYSSDTGWNTSWNGGCGAQATATYFPVSDQTVITTTVQSPYLFAGCRVSAHVMIGTRNRSFDGATHVVGTCAVLDPT